MVFNNFNSSSGFRLLGEGEREYCNATASFYLANPLCDDISWKWQGEPDSSSAAAEVLAGFNLEQWALYPNPADRGSVIEYKATAAPLELRVLQSDGRPVLEQELSGQQGQYRLNTRQWPAGLYLISLFHNGALVAYHRLAVQH